VVKYLIYEYMHKKWPQVCWDEVLIKVRSKETEAVAAALGQHVRKLPATLKRSLTWDRGLEMAKHKDFTVATDVQVYFCDPQSPWQTGHERKYQSAAAAILPARHRPVRLLSRSARPGLAALESKTEKDSRISHSRG
jgi:hypothetical protein